MKIGTTLAATVTVAAITAALAGCAPAEHVPVSAVSVGDAAVTVTAPLGGWSTVILADGTSINVEPGDPTTLPASTVASVTTHLTRP